LFTTTSAMETGTAAVGPLSVFQALFSGILQADPVARARGAAALESRTSGCLSTADKTEAFSRTRISADYGYR
jgi:hypothetical protein